MDPRASLKRVTPPIVLDGVREYRRRRSKALPDWTFLGHDWPEETGPGWNAVGVVDAYRRKLPTFRDAIAAPAPIGVTTEALSAPTADAYHQNVILEHAYAVARASAGRDRISVLDWGGGFGFLSFVIAELFPELEVDFHVCEVPLVVDAARPLVPMVTFWDDDACLDRSYDLVVAASSLQYERDWRARLGQFAGRSRWVLLSRLPTTPGPRSFVVGQRAYGTSYVGWVIARGELLAVAKGAIRLEREMLEGWSAEIPGAPEINEHRGFLLRSVT